MAAPKLFATLRADAEGIRARKAEMIASLDQLQRLCSLGETAKARLVDARAAVLDDPADAKKINAYRAAYAAVAADQQLASEAQNHMRDRREAIVLELTPSLSDLGRRALALIDERLKEEGFSVRTGHLRLGESRLIEQPSAEVPLPNPNLGQLLLEYRDRIEQALAWRNSTPATLENVISLVEQSPI